MNGHVGKKEGRKKGVGAPHRQLGQSMMREKNENISATRAKKKENQYGERF